MPTFHRDGFKLHYEVHGTGTPVVMLHGAAVSFAVNFGIGGWVENLNAKGLQAVGIDFRGHGSSQKSYDTADYGLEKSTADVIALLDHLEIDRAALLGYSIGTTIGLHVLHRYPDRFTAAALVATGDGIIGHPPFTFPALMPALSEILRRPSADDLPPHIAMYWTFATEVCGDREAVAASAAAEYPPCTPEEAASVDIPVLVVSGSTDQVLGQGARLAEAFPKGTYREIPERDHFMLAVDPEVSTPVADFLAAAV